MLIPVDELDEINQALCRASGWIALDKSNGNYLSKACEPVDGQNGLYIFHVRNKMSIVIRETSDQGAIDKANYK